MMRSKFFYLLISLLLLVIDTTNGSTGQDSPSTGSTGDLSQSHSKTPSTTEDSLDDFTAQANQITIEDKPLYDKPSYGNKIMDGLLEKMEFSSVATSKQNRKFLNLMASWLVEGHWGSMFQKGEKTDGLIEDMFKTYVNASQLLLETFEAQLLPKEIEEYLDFYNGDLHELLGNDFIYLMDKKAELGIQLEAITVKILLDNYDMLVCLQEIRTMSAYRSFYSYLRLPIVRKFVRIHDILIEYERDRYSLITRLKKIIERNEKTRENRHNSRSQLLREYQKKKTELLEICKWLMSSENDKPTRLSIDTGIDTDIDHGNDSLQQLDDYLRIITPQEQLYKLLAKINEAGKIGTYECNRLLLLTASCIPEDSWETLVVHDDVLSVDIADTYLAMRRTVLEALMVQQFPDDLLYTWILHGDRLREKCGEKFIQLDEKERALRGELDLSMALLTWQYHLILDCLQFLQTSPNLRLHYRKLDFYGSPSEKLQSMQKNKDDNNEVQQFTKLLDRFTKAKQQYFDGETREKQVFIVEKYLIAKEDLLESIKSCL